MTINILGTEYTVQYDTEKQNPKLRGLSGYCDTSVKKIILENDLDESHPQAVEKMDFYKNKTFRHEIIHAFFEESGLSENYSSDEMLVDWIAIQFPKMLELFKKIDCL